jgi:hypothetical protein
MPARNKVCVVTGDDRPVLSGEAARDSYPSLTYEINRRFCEHAGWDFRYELYRLPKRPWGSLAAYCSSARQHRASSWLKLLAVSRALDLGYEQVLWIDSDCIFYNHEADWSDFVAMFRPDGVRIAGWIDRPYFTDQICAGFFGVQNCDEVRSLLSSIWTRPAATSVVHPYEQAELVADLRQRPAGWYHLVDEPMFSLEDRNQRILHVASNQPGLRKTQFLEWFSERGLSFCPQKLEAHVHSDLDLAAADRALSGRGPGMVEHVSREAFVFWQLGQRRYRSFRVSVATALSPIRARVREKTQ